MKRVRYGTTARRQAVIMLTAPSSITGHLKRNLLNLGPGDLPRPAVVQLGRLRGRVTGDDGRALQETARAQERGDAGRAEGVIADMRLDAGSPGAPLQHRPGHPLGHGPAGWPESDGSVFFHFAVEGLEHRQLAEVTDTQPLKISDEIQFELAMTGHFVRLAPLFMQTQPKTALLMKDVLNLNLERRIDTAEGVRHGGDERAVAKPNQRGAIDAVQKGSDLFSGQHRGFANIDAVARPLHDRRRVGVDTVGFHQRAEQHAHRRQPQFDGGRSQASALHGGNPVRHIDGAEGFKALSCWPLARKAQEILRSAKVRPAGVDVADFGLEEFQDRVTGAWIS